MNESSTISIEFLKESHLYIVLSLQIVIFFRNAFGSQYCEPCQNNLHARRKREAEMEVSMKVLN